MHAVRGECCTTAPLPTYFFNGTGLDEAVSELLMLAAAENTALAMSGMSLELDVKVWSAGKFC